MDFFLSGSTQTFHTLNELNACRSSVQHSKVRWRAVARRSSQLKPYILGGRTRCLGGQGGTRLTICEAGKGPVRRG